MRDRHRPRCGKPTVRGVDAVRRGQSAALREAEQVGRRGVVSLAEDGVHTSSFPTRGEPIGVRPHHPARPAAAVWGGCRRRSGLDETGGLAGTGAGGCSWRCPRNCGRRRWQLAPSSLRETAEPSRGSGRGCEIVPRLARLPTPASLAHAHDGVVASRLRRRLGRHQGRRGLRSVAPRGRRRRNRAAGRGDLQPLRGINAVISADRDEDRVIGFRPDHTSITTLSIGPHGLVLVERGAEAPRVCCESRLRPRSRSSPSPR